MWSTYLAYMYLLSDDPHHSYFSFARHHIGYEHHLADLPLNQYDYIDNKALPSQSAVFLYNESIGEHIEFLHDVRARGPIALGCVV